MVRSLIMLTLAMAVMGLVAPMAQAQIATGSVVTLASPSLAVQVVSPPQIQAASPPGLITVNFVNADIRDVLSVFAQQAKVNIVSSNDVQGQVTIGLSQVPFDEGLKAILLAANLTYEKVGGTYVVRSADRPAANTMAGLPVERREVTGSHLVSLNIKNADLAFAVENLINQAGLDVVVLGSLNGKVTARLSQMPLDEALGIVLSGTRYGFNRYRDIYVIGDPNNLAGNAAILTTTAAIPLNYRQAADILNLLPPSIPTTMIKPDEADDTLLVTGTREFVDQVRAFVRQVDVPAKQVLLETTVLELSKNASKKLGLTFSGQFGTDVALNSSNPLVIAVTQGGKGSPAFQATLTALMQSGKVRVKANPKIAVTNGQEAQINVVSDVNVKVTSPSTGLVPTTTLQTIQAGTILKITPYIGASGDVSTKIDLEVSSISGLSSDGLPEVSRRQVATTMRLADGQTIAIGGIVNSDSYLNVDKIPLLGDLPVIGTLFRTESLQTDESELVFMLTPRILK